MTAYILHFYNFSTWLSPLSSTILYPLSPVREIRKNIIESEKDSKTIALARNNELQLKIREIELKRMDLTEKYIEEQISDEIIRSLMKNTDPKIPTSSSSFRDSNHIPRIQTRIGDL